MSEPEVPVTVSVAFPNAATLLAVSVSVLTSTVGLGDSDAVTPLGSPEMARLTLPLNPYSGMTETVDVPELPCPMFRLLVWSVKLGAKTPRARVVVAETEPEVPVMVSVVIPRAAPTLAVRVRVLLLLVGFGEKDAATPLGRPEMARLTLPLKPYKGWTKTVDVPELPCPMFRL